jgi:hypothetical protein
MTRMTRIIGRLCKLALGLSGSVTQRWKALPIRVILEISGFNSAVRDLTKSGSRENLSDPIFLISFQLWRLSLH